MLQKHTTLLDTAFVLDTIAVRPTLFVSIRQNEDPYIGSRINQISSKRASRSTFHKFLITSVTEVEALV